MRSAAPPLFADDHSPRQIVTFQPPGLHPDSSKYATFSRSHHPYWQFPAMVLNGAYRHYSSHPGLGGAAQTDPQPPLAGPSVAQPDWKRERRDHVGYATRSMNQKMPVPAIAREAGCVIATRYQTR